LYILNVHLGTRLTFQPLLFCFKTVTDKEILLNIQPTIKIQVLVTT